MKRRAAIIAYDIVCDRRRKRARRCMQAWSLDGQYSLFECHLTQQEAGELFVQLGQIIDTDEDALLLAWLDRRRPCEALTNCATPAFLAPALYVS